MGILSWLFPSTADRIAKAQRLMADERFAEARLEVIDLEDPAADALRIEAEKALVQLNLKKALEWARAGDESQVNGHLDLAEQMHDGSMDELFRDTEVKLEVFRKAHLAEQSWTNLKTFALRRKKLGTDPGDFSLAAYSGVGAVRLFFGGQRAFNLPSLELEPRSEWFVAPWMVIPESVDTLSQEEEQASIDALLARCGSEIEPLVQAESTALGRSLLYVAGQRPELAVEILMAADQDNPIVKLELGRAACALGDHLAASLAFNAGLDGLSAPMPELGVETLVVAAQYWHGDYKTAYERASTHLSTGAEEQRLRALTAIAASELDAAQTALAEMDEDDEARPQLDAFFRLQARLRALLDGNPALLDPEAENTAAWHDAKEAVVNGLQETLDDVMGQLKEAEENMPVGF